MTMARLRAVVAWTACALLAVPLANCAGNGHARSDERANVYPENYRNDMIGFLHTYINDPTQVRDAAIADPVLRLVSGSPDRGNSPLDKISRSFERGTGSQERYIVCVRFNAKDRDGRYTGLKNGNGGLHRRPLRALLRAAARTVRSGGLQAVPGTGDARPLTRGCGHRYQLP